MGAAGYRGALWEDLLLVTWLMGLLTKAPTFRIKMVSKRSCGELHFPSLLFDTVSVSSLGEENRPITDSWYKQHWQILCLTGFLYSSGFTPTIGRTTEICPCTAGSSSVINTKGEWDANGIRFLFKAGWKLFSWKAAATWNRLFFLEMDF